MPIYNFPKGLTKAELQKALLIAANANNVLKMNDEKTYRVVLQDNGTGNPAKLVEQPNTNFGTVTITRVSTGIIKFVTSVATAGLYSFIANINLRLFDTNMVSFVVYKTSTTEYRLEVRKTSDGTLVDLWGEIAVEIIIVEDIEGI